MKQILDIVKEVLGNNVDENTSRENNNSWDSLKTLQIVMALDEANYEIPIEKIAEIKSIQDILSWAILRERN